jgi:predicted permease
LGKSIVLDVFLVLGFGSAVVSVAFCVNARRIASKKRQETQLGNCIFIWGIFLALVNLIILVINTYMVFT